MYLQAATSQKLNSRVEIVSICSNLHLGFYRAYRHGPCHMGNKLDLKKRYFEQIQNQQEVGIQDGI